MCCSLPTLAGGFHFGTNLCCVRWVKFLLVPLRRKKKSVSRKRWDSALPRRVQAKGMLVVSGGGKQALLLWHHSFVASHWADTTIPCLSFPPYISRAIKLARFEFVLRGQMVQCLCNALMVLSVKRGFLTAKCCRAFSNECPGIKVLSLVPWFSPSPGKEKGKTVEGIVQGQGCSGGLIGKAIKL